MNLKNQYIKTQLVFRLILFVLFFLGVHINAQQNLKDTLTIVQLIEESRQLHKQDHNEKEEYRLANLAIDKALVLEDTLMYARSLDNLGLLYRYHEWYKLAMNLHVRAYELVEHKKVETLYKMIFANNAGLAARYSQQYDDAVIYYLKALKLAEQENNLKNIAISSNGLGNTLSKIPREEEQAIFYFNKAVESSEARNDSLGMAMNYLSIAYHYIDNNNAEAAFETLSKLKEINEKLKDEFGIAITNEAMGRAYINVNNNPILGKEYLTKALKGYEKVNKIYNVAHTYNRLGNNEILLGNKKEALNYFQNSLQLAYKLELLDLIVKNSFSISSLMEEKGKLKEALEYYKNASRYQDSLGLKNQEIKISALTQEYDLDKKESEIALLEKDKILKEEEIRKSSEKIKNQKLFSYVLAICVLGIILFSLIQYRNISARRAAEKQLQENEKQLLQTEYKKSLAEAEITISRMQVNPHFIFNCLNAINLLIKKEENKSASRYLNTFSRFIRLTLELPKKETISLEEELKLINYYLELEEYRFGGSFTYEIESKDVNLSQVKIPPMLLQPIIENAIWHGLLVSRKDSRELKIIIEEHGDGTRIIIDDNGIGRKKSKELKTGYIKKKSLGMKITSERIEHFNNSFDCKIKMIIIDKPDNNGTQVILDLQ